MDDFEEKIKQFTEKVKSDNPYPEFRVLTTTRPITINVSKIKRELIQKRTSREDTKKVDSVLPPYCTKETSNGTQPRKIKTPQGIFKSVKDAATALGCASATIIYHCTRWTDRNYYYYEGDE